MAKYTPTISRRQCMALAKLVTSCDSLTVAALAVERMAKRCRGNRKKRGTWKYFLSRAAVSLRNGIIPFEVFAMEGNVKLPFVAFSTLPIVTCPGAGDCVNWCYSLRAWRYPAAFLRQVCNTLRLRFNRRSVIDAFKSLPAGITLRLYVDGDFDSRETFTFWMMMLRQRPDIRAYGYSKSWDIILECAGIIPSNYVFNLSSGGRFDGNAEMKQRMLALPSCRGEFVAVRLRRKHAKGFKKYSSADYHRDVRESAVSDGIGKVFSCPGACGSCTGAGHACGGVFPLTIAIGIH
jgi:hypothetical protein